MPEKYRVWDVVNYLDSPKRAFFYLEAAAEEDEGDGDLIRMAWSDIKRAHKTGKVSINIPMNGEELAETLKDYGVYDEVIDKITVALGMEIRITE